MAETRRKVVADLVAVVACLVLPLAMVSSWVAGVVTNTDRYVSTVGPLAADADIKAAVERELNRLVLEAVDLPRQRAAIAAYLQARGVGEQVTARSEPLAALIESLVRDAVAKAVHRVVDSDQFAQAWEAANRSAHEQLVAVLHDDDTSALDDQGRVSIRLATLVNSVLEEVGSSLPLPLAIATVPDVAASFPLMKASDLSKARHGYRALDAVGFWFPIVWLVLVGAALAWAPSRRRALAFLGYGGIIALVVLSVGLALARHVALGAVPAVDRDLAELVWRQLFARLYDAVRVGLLVAAVVLLLRWLAGAGDRPVAVRTAARSSVAALRRTEPATMRAVAIVASVVAVFWILW